jgi:hypothetical protein
MGPMKSGGYTGPQNVAMEPELSESEKALRDRFVQEYLVDYSPLNAARRVGFGVAFAETYAALFMKESYVRKRIEDFTHRVDVDEEDMDAYDKRRVRAGLMREAHDKFASGSSRVAALSKLMSLLGMDAPLKIDNNVNHRGNVMMVPGIAGMDEWERAAMDQQRKLADSAREDIH